MRFKLISPLVVAALLASACLELPAIEQNIPKGDNPSDAGTTQSIDDAGVSPQKRPPEVIETHQTTTSIPGGGVVALRIVSRDPQESTLNFSWQASVGALGNSTNTQSSSEVNWTAPNCGSLPSETTATIKASIANALGLSNTMDFRVTAFCRSPEITDIRQSDTTASEGKTVTLRIIARDPHNGALNFSWHAETGSLGTPISTATSSEVIWTAPACDTSSSEKTVTLMNLVTNEQSLSTSASFKVTVTCSKWIATYDMASARRQHAATLLPSGKVLVSGGYNGGYLATAEL